MRTALAGVVAPLVLLVTACVAQPATYEDPQEAPPPPTQPPMPGPDQQPPRTPGPPGSPGTPQSPGPDDAEQQTSTCPSGGGGGGPGSKVAMPSTSGGGSQRSAGQARPPGSEGAADAPSASAAAGSGPSPVRARAADERPVLRLCFEVDKDRRTVKGRETITFVPDRRVCELVFRAWPNKPETAKAGNRLKVDEVAIGKNKVKPKVEAAGAPRGVPGTLIRVPVDGCVAAGKSVEATLDFSLTLGRDSAERVGYSPDAKTSWFGSAFPLLAWEGGRGWAEEPAVPLYGETATSEAFKLESLEVIAPKGEQVVGVGEREKPQKGPEKGTTLHTFKADAVRDVAVTVGQLQLSTETTSGVRIHVATPKNGSSSPPATWRSEVATLMVRLLSNFGEFPYDDLWVSVVPGFESGIEFPGHIMFGDVDALTEQELIAHELAHMWFYGLVGNNQARDPWLDEAFATYGEIVATATFLDGAGFNPPPPVRNKVGEPMSWYSALDNPSLYTAGVYRQGGAMMLEIRATIGGQRWDRMLKSYLKEHANKIVTVDDVADMVSDEPRARAILEEYGALPR